MSHPSFEIAVADSASSFVKMAQAGLYQLVTGPGSEEILQSLEKQDINAALRNCVLSSSIGQNARALEDMLDDLIVDSGEVFFPTVSDVALDEITPIIWSYQDTTKRLIILSQHEALGLEINGLLASHQTKETPLSPGDQIR
ncbi:hypothetical protein ACVNHC_13000 [Pannonibacter sp. Q-1]|uniref:hypothetical protein n=1 Tax=Pannonibacter phragmitetus TaxID=121719 RepID=UPI000F01FD53|nr:hypothetical protein [Pannonibacter phragmitetus]